ncbi:MAG: cation transporter [Enterococcus sp.]|jgi:copper chaperone CopZ|uniref:heavy-metal-associated domain-containing protein n=1 Tax=Enterococcus TaxID=1350 RepID=UPI002FC69153
MEKVILQLDTLSCPSCMQKIEAALSQQAGVKQVKVLFNASKVKAEIDSSLTTAATLKTTVENLGYQIKSVKVKA